MSGASRWFKGSWPLVAFALFWSAFVLWGILAWKEANFWTYPWWFDTLRHSIFGLAGAPNLRYYYKIRPPTPASMYYGRNVLDELVIGRITRWAVYWEAVELLYDLILQPNFTAWLIKMQSGAADNTVDILVTMWGARMATLLYRPANALYKKLFPSDLDIEETITEEMTGMFENASKEIGKMRKENLRQLLPALKSAVRDFLQNLKRGGQDEK